MSGSHKYVGLRVYDISGGYDYAGKEDVAGDFISLEDLQGSITQGRLRVVEPCEPRLDPQWPGMTLFGCNGRGPVTDEAFCPYCGGSIPPTSYETPIKRDA
jgi:hypothetical protein